MNTVEKLALLCSKVRENNIGTFVVYSADPHLSEYLPKEWLGRAWLSGFTGSAGLVVITDDKAGLWTSSRYFVQSAIELKGSGIDLFRDGVEGTPDYTDWLVSVLLQGVTVAVNVLVTSHVVWEKLQATLNANGLKLVHKPLLDTIWANRKKDPLHHVFAHPDKWAGQTIADKLKAIREVMAAKRTQLHLIAALDDVAWTLNLRGSDVVYNPVFLSYIALTDKETTLFVDKTKLIPEVEAHLAKAQVAICDYDAFHDYLSTVEGQSILLATNTNQAIFEALQKDNHIVQVPAPGNLMKAVKNETELVGFRTVMERDGVAMVDFLYWLTHQADKEPMTEYSIGKKLREFHAAGANFVGGSFGNIIGYQSNGAIVRYSAPERGSKEVHAEGSILVDLSFVHIFESTRH